MPATGRANPVRTGHGRTTGVDGVRRDVDARPRRRYRVALLRTALVLALSPLVACASLGSGGTRPNVQPWPEIRADYRVEVLRLRMHEYAITFAAEVEVASNEIERRATDATVRRNAVLWRVRAIPEMRKACFRLEPVAALVDAWIFARQMDQLFRDGAGAGAFGTLQPEALEVSRRMIEQMRQIGDSIAVSAETRVQFEQRFVDPWLADHPLHDVSFVRESPIGRFAEQVRASGDTLQSVGTIEELAVTLSQQARIYLAELPRQVRGEVDLMLSDIIPPVDVASLQGDLHKSAAAVDRIATTAESISPLVVDERRIILDEISRQRAMVMDGLSIESQRAVSALVHAFTAERTELLRDLEAQRMATLKWATAERLEAVADLRREFTATIEVLRSERAIVVDDLRHIVDTVLLRVGIFIVAVVLLAPLVAHIYARVWPRRWREP